uniref:Sf118 n=1 Tax=Spodoptera frugiperda nuclear polyhedrosis virus TaxID=10455 RepID=A0A891XM01_NPVSF|nr:Sf118 [Spodoptera frugiperda multiple nucleopolyhedrovirus]
MDEGKLCLVIDSFRRQLRLLNKRVLLIQENVDFEEPLPDLENLKNNLTKIRSDLKYVLQCAENNIDTNLDVYISHHTINELDFMLRSWEKCLLDNIPFDIDEFNVTLKTCVYMFNNVKRINFKNYMTTKPLYDNNNIESFVHQVCMYCKRSNKYTYMLNSIRNLVDICDKIKIRLSMYELGTE